MSHASLFAALGDETRLSLVTALARGRARSISQLTEGSSLTRQAITKHLRVMEEVGLVRSSRAGRETLFSLDPAPLREMEEFLSRVSMHWDDALSRLKAFVEEA